MAGFRGACAPRSRASSTPQRPTAPRAAARARAHLTSRSPCRKHSNEGSFANLAEKAKLVFASPAAAVAGERGVCAPCAAASARSPRPLLHGSPQESCRTPRCSLLRCSWASPQVCSTSRSAPGIAPWRRQQVCSSAAPRARTRGGDASAPPEPPPGRARSRKTSRHAVRTWSTWSAVINLTSRAGELRSAPSGPDDRYRVTG